MPDRPEDVEVEDAYRFLAPRLQEARRVLDVGCGNGLLARRLAQGGLDVTALDRSLQRVERTAGLRYVEADFLDFEDVPYDALVLSASLHHLFPLSRALDTAHRLLRPGGWFLATDFDVEAPDLATARWYYDVEGLLLAAGLYRPEKVAEAEVEDALARWHAEHVHTPSFHTGHAMREGLARRFTDVGWTKGPYLFRYVAGCMVPFPKATAVTVWMLAAEERQLAAGSLQAVGLRLWGRKSGASEVPTKAPTL
jgi:SAM-dependent methyltransferase